MVVVNDGDGDGVGMGWGWTGRPVEGMGRGVEYLHELIIRPPECCEIQTLRC